jgi:hypothetical protein
MTTRSGEAEYVWEIALLPRGGGNRQLAADLARHLRTHKRLGPHIRRVKVQTSKVVVHFQFSGKLSVDLLRELLEQSKPDVPGQLPLFIPDPKSDRSL